MGNFTISDVVFRQIAEYLAKRSEAIYKVMRTRVESTPEGPNIYMEVSINYGYNILGTLRTFKEKIKKRLKIDYYECTASYDCGKGNSYARTRGNEKIK